MPLNKTQLILASASPRRRELLRQAGYRFVTRPPPESREDALGRSIKALTPGAYVESMAYLKAAAAIEAHGLKEGLVLGADTVVDLDGQLIGKPNGDEDARQILRRLSGTRHRVLTGLALVDLGTGRRLLAHEVTLVHMRPMTDAEIAAYVASGEADGKAGAYALQETADRYVESIQGSYTNVVGLPTELLERLLKAAGYDPASLRDLG